MKYITRKTEIQKEIKARVSKWLRDSEVIFLEDKEAISLGSEPVDFLVVKPFPMVIQIKGFSPFMRQFQAKDILAQRINLANQYGRYMPVIAITSREDKQIAVEDRFRFFDAVIDSEELPNFYELRNSIKLNELVQGILEKGEPKDFHITDSQEIEAMWDSSLNLSDFFKDDSSNIGSLVRQLRLLSSEYEAKYEQQNIDDLPSEYEAKYKQQNINHLTDEAKALRLRLSRSFKNDFKEILKKEITKFDGGFEEPKISEQWLREYKLPSPQPLIWRSIYGRCIAFQIIFSFDSQYKNNRSRQLISDAWMIRSLLENKVDDLVILLEKSEENKSLTYFINVLESAGWTVLPWDFTKKLPLFMEFILEEREIFYEQIAKVYA